MGTGGDDSTAAQIFGVVEPGNGSSRVRSSYSVTPSDHTSLRASSDCPERLDVRPTDDQTEDAPF